MSLRMTNLKIKPKSTQNVLSAIADSSKCAPLSRPRGLEKGLLADKGGRVKGGQLSQLSARPTSCQKADQSGESSRWG